MVSVWLLLLNIALAGLAGFALGVIHYGPRR